MSTCNALHVSAYVLHLERLRKEGYFDNFSKDDYNGLIEKSIEYFERFKTNLDKYEKNRAENPTERGINFISKHHFSFLDFSEELGTALLEMDESKAKVLTKFDVIGSGEDFEYPVTKEDKGRIIMPTTLQRLGIELDYDREDQLMYLRENLYDMGSSLVGDIGTLFSENQNYTDMSNAPYNHFKEHTFPEIERFFGSVAKANALKAEDISYQFDYFTLDTIKREVTQQISMLMSGDREPFGSKFSLIDDSPVSINNESIKATYLDKKELSKVITSLIVSAVHKKAQEIYNRVSDLAKDVPLPDNLRGELDMQLSPAVEASVAVLIKHLQTYHDNEIVMAINEHQKGSTLHTQSFLNRMFGTEGRALFERFNGSREGVILSFNAIANKKELGTFPILQKGSVKFSELSFLYEDISDSLDRIEKNQVMPEKVKHTISLKRKTAELEVLSFDHDKELRLIAQRNDTGNQYLINRNFSVSDYFKIVIIDESDQKAGGKFANNFREVAKHAEKIIASSGTLVAGTASDIVSQIGLSGRMSTLSIEKNKREFTMQNGSFEILSGTKSSKFMAYLVAGVNNLYFSDTLESVYRAYHEAMESKGNDDKDGGVNTHELLLNGIENHIAPALMENGIAPEGSMDRVDFNKEARKIKILFTSMSKVSKENNNVLSFKNLVMHGLFKSHSLLALRPGLNNAKTFVDNIKSAGDQNISIMSRESLSGKKETLIIDDLATHKLNFPKVEGMGNANNYTAEDFVEHNRVGVRLVQAAVQEYATSNFLYSVSDFLTSNFGHFMKNFVDSKKKEGEALNALVKYFNKKHNNTFTSGSLSTLFETSTSSGSDDFVGIYKNYLNYNGDLDKNKKYATMEPLKKEVFQEIVSLYDDFIKKGIKAIESGEKYILPLGEGGGADLSGSNYYYVSTFKSGVGEYSAEELLKDVSHGYPQSFVFSVLIDVCPPEYRYLFDKPNENGLYMPYRLKFTVEQENEVLDAMASKGVAKEVSEQIKNGDGFVLSSLRTAGTMLNYLAALDVSITHKKEDASGKRIAGILNVPSSTAEEGLSYRRISEKQNESILEEHGISPHPIPRTALDSTLKSSIEKEMLPWVVSNYEAISRGISLAGLNKIISTSSMPKKKELIQFLARLFSVNRYDALISMFNGGYDAKISPNEPKDRKALLEMAFPARGEASDKAEYENMIQKSLSSLLDIENKGNEGMDVGLKILKDLPFSYSFGATEMGVVSERGIDSFVVAKAFMSGEKTSIDSVIGTENGKKSAPFSPSVDYEEKVTKIVEDMKNGIHEKRRDPISSEKTEQNIKEAKRKDPSGSGLKQ